MIQKVEEIAEELILGLRAEGTFKREVITVVMGKGVKNSVLIALQMINL